MSASVGSAHFSLRARADNLGSDIKSAMKLAQRRLVSAGRVIGKAVTVSLTVAVAAMTAAITKGINSIDQLAKESTKLGVATEKLQLLRHAANLTGVEATKLGTGLQRMTRRVAEAALGTGEAVNALKELNLDARELNRLSPDEVFLRVGDAMRGVSNQSDRIRLAMKLFDSEGVGLVNTLNLTRNELNQMESELKVLGVTISRQTAIQVEQAKDQFTRLGTVFVGITNQLTIGFAPILSVVTDRIVELKKETSFFSETIGYLHEKAIDLGETFTRLPIALNQLAISYAKARLETARFFGNTRAVVRITGELGELIKERAGLAGEAFFNGFATQVQRAKDAAQEKIDSTLRGDAGGKPNPVLGMLDDMISQFERTKDPLAQIKKDLKGIEEALKAGIVKGAELVREKVELVKTAIVEFEAEAAKQAQRATEHWQSFAFNATSAIDQFVETGRFSIKSFVNDVLKDLAKIQVRNLLLGSNGITGGILGGLFKGIGAPITSTTGSAMGNHLEAGESSFVGERGIERFVPDVAGTILPHNQTQGMIDKMGGGNVSVTNNIHAGVNRQDLALAMQETKNETIKAILDAQKSGGSFSAAFS